jgi:hypothetical protein
MKSVFPQEQQQMMLPNEVCIVEKTTDVTKWTQYSHKRNNRFFYQSKSVLSSSSSPSYYSSSSPSLFFSSLSSLSSSSSFPASVITD